MINRVKILIWIIGLVFLVACQEIYDPEIITQERLLVVDGLVTNRAGRHAIKLAYTKVLGDYMPSEKISRAIVNVRDEEGHRYGFYEEQQGVYVSYDFVGRAGEFYVLEIFTYEGFHYESIPQRVPEPITIDSVYAVRGIEPFYYISTFTNELFRSNTDVLNIFAVIPLTNGQFPRFRFTSDIYLQYVKVDNAPFLKNETLATDSIAELADEFYNYFCWLKKSVVDYLGTDVSQYQVPYESASHRIGVVPRYSNQMMFMGFPIGFYSDHRVFYNTFYTLNEESYTFHQKRNEQIRGQGGLFDPVVTQLPGNIFCVNDPTQKVLGFFEASNEQQVMVYNITDPFLWENYHIEFIDYFEPFPPEGCRLQSFPEFWIF